MKLTAVAAAAAAAAAAGALLDVELLAFEAVFPALGDFKEAGRIDAAAAACCWLNGKIKAAPGCKFQGKTRNRKKLMNFFDKGSTNYK